MNKLKAFFKNPYVRITLVLFVLTLVLVAIFNTFPLNSIFSAYPQEYPEDISDTQVDVAIFFNDLLYMYTLPAVIVMAPLLLFFSNNAFAVVAIFVVMPILWSLPFWFMFWLYKKLKK